MAKDAKVGNAADPEQVKRAKLSDKDIRKQELSDLRFVMESPEGRRMMWRIINNLCHVNTLSAENSGSLTYFKEGAREVGLTLKTDVYEEAFNEWQLMEQEHVNYVKGGR
ncbi:MAG: hypothetical protein KAR06_06965 [Deltaproteobacteria bacterium]|nr:hypothetical protein [Deltaproteobacteria bacterium]